MTINLDGLRFKPAKGGDSVFAFTQEGSEFCAHYTGGGFTDGNLIGVMTGSDTADLVYHCRAPDGSLEVGQAATSFAVTAQGLLRMSMAWQWLNGDQSSGLNHYDEIRND